MTNAVANQQQARYNGCMTPQEMKALRLHLGWTQQQMADHIGLAHRSQVQRMETGKYRIWGPALKMLEALQRKSGPKKESKS